LLVLLAMASSSRAATRSAGAPAAAVVAFVMVDRFADGAPNLADVVHGHPRRF